MNTKSYISFLKWFYKYTNDEFPEKITNYSFRRGMIRKERLPILIVSYILLIISCLFFVITIVSANCYYWLALGGIISSIILLLRCEFSFIYYFIAYIKFKNKDKSINDNAIFTYGILNVGNSELLSIVNKYFNYYVKSGNIFAIKIRLIAKGKKRRKDTSNIKKILKITPNKIYLNRKVIFDNKLLDISDLEKFLSEESSKW